MFCYDHPGQNAAKRWYAEQNVFNTSREQGSPSLTINFDAGGQSLRLFTHVHTFATQAFAVPGRLPVDDNVFSREDRPCKASTSTMYGVHILSPGNGNYQQKKVISNTTRTVSCLGMSTLISRLQRCGATSLR